MEKKNLKFYLKHQINKNKTEFFEFFNLESKHIKSFRNILFNQTLQLIFTKKKVHYKRLWKKVIMQKYFFNFFLQFL